MRRARADDEYEGMKSFKKRLGCWAQGEDSISKVDRRCEAVAPQSHLAVSRVVDRRLDVRTQRAEVVRAEHERPDGHAPAPEDEIVGAGAGELQLRLLDQEQILDGLRQRPVAVLDGYPQ